MPEASTLAANSASASILGDRMDPGGQNPTGKTPSRPSHLQGMIGFHPERSLPGISESKTTTHSFPHARIQRAYFHRRYTHIAPRQNRPACKGALDRLRTTCRPRREDLAGGGTECACRRASSAWGGFHSGPIGGIAADRTSAFFQALHHPNQQPRRPRCIVRRPGQSCASRKKSSR